MAEKRTKKRKNIGAEQVPVPGKCPTISACMMVKDVNNRGRCLLVNVSRFSHQSFRQSTVWRGRI